MKKRDDKRWTRWVIARVVLAVLAGGGAGYLYYATIGCMTGTCPITSNPFLTTGLGAFIAGTFAWPGPAAGRGSGARDEAEPPAETSGGREAPAP